MTCLPRLAATTARLTLALAAATLSSACAIWADTSPPVRASVALNGQPAIARSERVQRLVAEMDARAFPNGGPLALKLSYELTLPGWPPALAAADVEGLDAGG